MRMCVRNRFSRIKAEIVCAIMCVRMYVCMRLSAHLFYDAHSFERPHH